MKNLKEIFGPKERVELIAELLDKTLKKAKELGFDSADTAEGLLLLCIQTMTAAVGPAKTAKWLRTLAQGTEDQAQKAENAELN